jgi:uncharacterized protein YndB with AHSA1/START domain
MKKAKTSLQVRKFIKAKRERVYAAWTDPELMKKWFAPGTMTVPAAEANAIEGGQYHIQMRKESGELHTAYGEYQQIIPQQKLVFTWGWEGPNHYETLVTVEFNDKDGGTEVILTHERFKDAEDARHHTEGWQGCLESLEKHFGTH